MDSEEIGGRALDGPQAMPPVVAEPTVTADAPSVRDWDWLADLPHAWSAPPELRSPTEIPMHNLVIQILSSGLVGNEVIEQLGELLAAYAALDRWGETGELSMTPQEFVRVGLRASGITRDVYRAWRAFSRTVEGTGGRTAAAAHEEHGLTSALSSATTRLKALRGGPWG